MTFGELLSPVVAFFRLIATFLGRRREEPKKRLEASLLLRGIVAEIPEELPFYLCNEEGSRHRGVYVIGLVVWNKGDQPITQADILPSSKLQVVLGDDAALVSAKIVPVEEQTDCSVTVVDAKTLQINFDCINQNEYLVIPIFCTGNPMTEVKVTGRIIGQENPVDHTAAEVRAPFLERLSVLVLLLIFMNTLPGLLIAGGYIFHDYGVSVLLHNPDTIPVYLMMPFSMGAMITAMFVFSRIMYWVERKKYPEGYPLYADLEPPLLENIKGMLRTVLKGQKYRISVSIFDWGKPVLLTGKKTKRRTIDDWIQ
ncbi:MULTISPECIES: hypothetical protein [unclassified Pseudomonas]|uniref:hypothetical protein n=1 Tax=unclassified Pseudomonas TaxID=196821 RepID=UPI0028930447|nr:MULTISPECIES: hypothetical protein [unclassified Pseudomonas]